MVIYVALIPKPNLVLRGLVPGFSPREIVKVFKSHLEVAHNLEYLIESRFRSRCNNKKYSKTKEYSLKQAVIKTKKTIQVNRNLEVEQK